jgi:hypothetical protein
MKSLPRVATGLIAAIAAFVAPGAAYAAGESTVISGKAYVDLTNVEAKNDGTKTAASGTGVDVKRFYLGVTHVFDDTWSANITTDFNYVGSDGETQLYVKKAYVRAKLSDAFAGLLGSADLPWVPFVEDLYGYRYVENTLVDRLKFATSADWGIHAVGKVAGRASYAVSVVNGAGYKNPKRSNSMDVEARLGLAPIPGLTLAIGGYSGKLGNDVENATTFHSARRLNALVAYVDSGLRLGAEYFQARDWNQVTTTASDEADGFSVWASYDFTPVWGVLARADRAKPSKELKPSLEDEYLNLGAVAHVRKDIDVAFVYKREKVRGDGAIGTSNGTIGATREGTYEEIGVWLQAVF